MALASRSRGRHDEEGESVFVSMTDLSISFLFVVLVLLAFFATQFRPEDAISQEEYEALAAALSDAGDGIRRLEEALADAGRTIGALRKSEAKLRDERDSALTAARSLEARNRQLEEAVEALRAERDAARERAALFDAGIELLTRDLEAVRAERNRVREHAASLESKIARLGEALAAASAERDDAQARAASLEAEVARLGEGLEATAAERDTAEARASSLEADVARFGEVLDAASSERDAARARAASLRAEIARLAEDLEAVRVERDMALARPASLDAEIARLERAVSDLESDIRRLLERIDELEMPDPLSGYLENASSARTALLERLAERIRQQLPGIRVTVVAADGVIRFRGDDLFESGQWRVRSNSTAERVSRAVGDALADTLPCYTVGGRAAFRVECNGAFAAIETIQIEGHTDDVPLGRRLRDRERMLDNRDLSARRGAETLRAVTDRYRPELMEFLNLHGQPVLSFAGYGAMRPIDRGDTPEARAANRRIDIRFILQTPQNVREVEDIRNRLSRNRPNLPPVVEGEGR